MAIIEPIVAQYSKPTFRDLVITPVYRMTAQGTTRVVSKLLGGHTRNVVHSFQKFEEVVRT